MKEVDCLVYDGVMYDKNSSSNFEYLLWQYNNGSLKPEFLIFFIEENISRAIPKMGSIQAYKCETKFFNSEDLKITNPEYFI